MRVLVAEDNELIAELVRSGFESVGWTVDCALTGADARKRLESQRYDFLILDIEFPDADGLDILTELRQGSEYLPVIVLTARTGAEAAVKGLSLGADDYVSKPFNVDELVARVLAVVRRTRVAPQEILSVGALTFNRLTRETLCNGRRLRLTPKEQGLLEQLLLAGDREVSREQLLQSVWRITFDPGSNLLDAHLARLRRKLANASAPVQIVTRKNVGFTIQPLTEPVTRQ